MPAGQWWLVFSVAATGPLSYLGNGQGQVI
jgi:hypothetical protein